MLSDRFDPATLPEPGTWHPYPTAQDRTAWDGVPGLVRERWMSSAERALEADWPQLPASLALLFLREGRRDYEGPQAFRRLYLIQMTTGELLEASGRFVDPVVDAVWSICEESAWNFPAHLHEQAAGAGLPDVTEPTIELGVGETAATLGWVSYLLADELDAVSPLVRRRIAHENRRRLHEVFLARDDFFWQSAVNNWVPWICCNIVSSVLLCELDRPFRDDVVRKAVAQLDRFIEHYPPDGGCDEGPTYWTRAGGMLFSALELLHSATGGALDVFAEPLIGEIGRYVHRMFVGDDWFVNFADGGARFRLQSNAFRYGRAIGDPGLEALGFELTRRSVQDGGGYPEAFTAMLPGLADLPALASSPPVDVPLVRDAVLPDIQVLVARDRADSTDGWFVAVKGGHNDEVHNHNDVGSLVAFLDGAPLLVDAGVGPYTRATFSHERYTIWTMQSGWHSVPTVNGVEQFPGKSAKARDWTTSVDDAVTEASVDIAGAYKPDAGLESWVRTVRLARGTGIDIADRWRLDDAHAMGSRATVHLLCAHEPDVVDEAGRVRLGPAELAVTASAPVRVDVVRREIPETEWNLHQMWGGNLWRIDVHLDDLPREGDLTVTLRRP